MFKGYISSKHPIHLDTALGHDQGQCPSQLFSDIEGGDWSASNKQLDSSEYTVFHSRTFTWLVLCCKNQLQATPLY